MSYHDALNYLAERTSVVELYDRLGGRVAVCPEWNGRILTSTFGGLEGNSFGCINTQAIDTGDSENFGGEDQWTISPLAISFAVESTKENNVVLRRTLRMADANGKPAEFYLMRSISLLGRQKIGTLFGDTVADALKQDDVSVVAFRSKNTVMSQEKACLASRQRGMFNAYPHTFIIISTPPEGFLTEPLQVDIDYLGGAPHGRIRRLLSGDSSRAQLIRADGHGWCQATIPFSAAPPIFGAVELRFGVLTLLMFDVPDGMAKDEDVIRICNHGRPQRDRWGWATYYEINSFSATREFLPGSSLSLFQYVLHISADNEILDRIVREIFDVSLKEFPKDVR